MLAQGAAVRGSRSGQCGEKPVNGRDLLRYLTVGEHGGNPRAAQGISTSWQVREPRGVIANLLTSLAVEILCAAQGLDLRAVSGSWRAPPAAPIRAVHAEIRARVPAMLTDREVAEQISAVDRLLPALTRTAAAHCGTLR